MKQNTFQKLAVATTGVAVVGLGIICAKSAQATTFADPFDDFYSFINLGSAPGVPSLYGGLTFLNNDPNTLLIGGNALNPTADIYALKVTRDSNNHITGFNGTATFFADSFGIGDGGQDTGLKYGPNGVLFYASSDNSVGQILPGSTSPNKLIDLTPLGYEPGPGVLTFVPSGFPGEGRLKISTFGGGGKIYDTTISPDGTGTFNIASPTTSVAVGSVAGIGYVDQSYPGFTAPNVLIADSENNKISAYAIDANGNPIANSRQDFLIDVSKPKPDASPAPLDITFDPVTGDILLTTQGIKDEVVLIKSEPDTTPLPPSTPDPNPFAPATSINLSSGSGSGSGTVSTGNEVFTFTAKAGDLLSFDVEATNIFPGNEYTDDDSVLYLYNSAGEILAVGDDSAEGTQARILNYLIQESGTYYAGVTSFGNEPIVELGRPFNTLTGFEGNGRSNFAFDLNVSSTPLPETARLFNIAFTETPGNPFGSVLINGNQILFLDLNGQRITDTLGPLKIIVGEDTLSFDNFEFVLQFPEPFASADINDILALLDGLTVTALIPPDELIEEIVFSERSLPGAATPQSVPEPTSVLSLLAFGVLGTSSLLKRKQQQKS